MRILRQMLKDVLRGSAESLLRVHLSTINGRDLAPDEIERILVFAYSGLGNFILYTPALKLLRATFPNARIDLQVGNNTGNDEVLEGAKLFDNIYNIPYSVGATAWIKRMIEIRNTGYDITVNEFHSHSWPLALMVAFSDAPFRAGHVTSPGWSERFSRYSFLFNIPVLMREDEHEIERYLDLVAALGATRAVVHSVKTHVHVTEEDRTFAADYFRALPRFGQSPIIGIQPGTSANMRWKQWPEERFRELMERLIAERPDLQIVLFGTATESAITNGLIHGLEANVTAATGKTTVKQVAAMIERCDSLICNDSGLMHVAVAVGTPVVAIYGPTDIRRTAPLGPGHTVIRHELPCSPCFRLEGEEQIHLCPHHDCLMTISPEEVFRIVNDVVLGRAKPIAKQG
jgi:heptosyltransferase-2